MGKTNTSTTITKSNHGENHVIGDDNLYEVLPYVDASYDTHNYMRGHTGGCMTFGWWLIHARFSKHKLNTKISTESEVVGARIYSPFIIWLDMYMEHQCYKSKQNQLMQDNMRAIKMDKNGKKLCIRNSRQINIRYLFVKERINKRRLKLFIVPPMLC